MGRDKVTVESGKNRLANSHSLDVHGHINQQTKISTMIPNRRSHWLRLSAGVRVAFVACLLVVVGCDDASMAPSPTDSDATAEEGLSPGVRMRVSFDQTERTYTSVWPGSIVGSDDAKEGATRGGKLMTEFEKTREVRSYDEDGYLTAEYEFIEGSPSMNMPEAAYEANKKQMPYDPSTENPIVRSELEGSTIRYVREDGSTARTRQIDPESFRIDPSKLDSLKETAEQSTMEERRKSVLQSLRSRGVSFNRMSDNHVRLRQRVSGDQAVKHVQKVIDLRTGRPVYLKYELKNGRTDLVETREYRFVSGVPMKVYTVTYDYDNRSGEWGVVARTEIMRKNISVQFN